MRILKLSGRKSLTLLEVMISVSVFIILISAAMEMLTTSQDLFESEISTSTNSENARTALERLVSELSETSLVSVDTAFRPQGFFKWSNHFKDPIPGNKHCTSNVENYPTSPEAHVRNRYSISIFGDAVVTDTQGKNWFHISQSVCPLDGSLLANDAYLDGVKFFSPRNEQGALLFSPVDGKIQYQSIVFYFPYRRPNQKTYSLFRYVVYLQDLFGSDPIPPGITLLKLWDFDGDGRPDDGGDPSFTSYNPFPSTVVDRFEVFETTIRWKKIQGSKKCELEINRQSGATTWTVENVEGITKTATFARPPHNFIEGLSDIDISTKASNPYDVSHLSGVEQDTVRVTLVFRRPVKGEITRTSLQEIVLSSAVKPRNK